MGNLVKFWNFEGIVDELKVVYGYFYPADLNGGSRSLWPQRHF